MFHACIIQQKVYTEKPYVWVAKAIFSILLHDISSYSGQEMTKLGSIEEAIEQARRSITCSVAAPGSNMLCWSCTWAVKYRGSIDCKEAFDGREGPNWVVKKAATSDDMVLHTSTVETHLTQLIAEYVETERLKHRGENY
jgi:hypothetical protein